MTHSNLREPAIGNTASGNGGKAGSGRAVPPTGGSASRAQAGLQQAYYYYDLSGQGVFERTLETPGLGGSFSQVFASVTEFYADTGKSFMGSAAMTVHNVVPLDGEQVIVRVDSGWPEELPVRVQLLYFA
ncbi:hypothetical protein ACFWWM_23450 [Streptomyces sp. NPDC058682]|uniref:hypothetical protein n=1 Tax=unclassified Streptomyces TaxID=2593676 RepID=UPI00224DFB6F|nr:hypothetical protein [Streptomyces sp. NBC_01214]MCX4808461.1 hypothetical protein [Streptomyces sp. NBC_01214]